MKFAAVIDRMDDWINPIVVKELRQAVKSRVVVALLMVVLGLELFLVGMFLMFREAKAGSGNVDWTAGREAFLILQGVLMVALMLLVPAYACVRLAGEHSDNNVDLLFISTLSPHSIIAGKFFAALVLAFLIFSLSAPFMTFTYLLRGIDIPTITITLGIDLLCMLGCTMVALFLAALPGGRPVKIFFCIMGFVVMLITCFMLTNVMLAALHEGASFNDSPHFWEMASVCTGATLGMVGLLFFYSVALISPPSSNRVLPLRVFLLAAYLLTGAGVLYGYSKLSDNDFLPVIMIWATLWMLVLGAQILISVSERDAWGPRAARAIPRNLLLRIPAFLLYTGSAGGLAFTAVLTAITAGTTLWWLDAHSASFPGGSNQRSVDHILTFLVVLLYLYCYGLLAVLFRIHLLASQVRQGFTWLITLLLIGVGSSVPAILAYILFHDQFNQANDKFWWRLPSPFLAIGEIHPSFSFGGSGNRDFATVCLWFVGVWAVVMTVLAMPWCLGQLRRFRPFQKRVVLLAELAERFEPAVVEPAPEPAPKPVATSIQPG
jgi:hypothetical protein